MHTFLGGRDGTGRIASPDPVAMPGNEPVAEFSERPGKYAQAYRESRPWLRQNTKAGEKGVGSNEQFLDWSAEVAEDQNCPRTLLLAWELEAVPGEQFLNRGRGRRSKAHAEEKVGDPRS